MPGGARTRLRGAVWGRLRGTTYRYYPDPRRPPQTTHRNVCCCSWWLGAGDLLLDGAWNPILPTTTGSDPWNPRFSALFCREIKEKGIVYS